MKKRLIFSALILSLFCLPVFGNQIINISMTRPPNAPYFIGIPELNNIDSDEFSTLVLRIRSNESGVARLFWASSYDPRMNEQKCILFNVGSSNNFREYVFNVKSQNRFWTGFIRQILIYPENGPEGFQIESAVAEHGNLFSDIKSGWREFWGPNSRLILGSTVNDMKATRLYGVPINWYLYVIVLLSSVLIFGYSFLKTKDLALSWQNCGKAAVIVAIASWGFLEFSNSISQYYQLKSDFLRFGFKSLEEKRAILVGKDFYDFLGFCRENIPARSTVKVISADPNKDFYSERAKYFLYPLNFFSKDPECIIVINYDKSLKRVLVEYPNFRLLKKYNEGAYILWKKK
jgi:hypothetical protein